MVASVLTSLVRGLEGRLVEVQVDIATGNTPSFALVGLATGSVREAKERVRSAVRNSGLPFPSQRKLTVNLAPGASPTAHAIARMSLLATAPWARSASGSRASSTASAWDASA